METGIYCILNKETGKRYVGSASGLKGFKARWQHHSWMLKNNKHHSPYLQASWNKHGEDNFEFKILEYVPAEFCIQREQWWLDLFGVADREYGYNMLSTAKVGSGIHSEIVKQKISNKLKGRIVSDATRNKLSDILLKNHCKFWLGKTLSAEHKQKLRDSKKNNPLSEESRDKISKANCKYEYQITTPNNDIILTKKLAKFAKDNNLDKDCLQDVARGLMLHHKNYKVEITKVLDEKYLSNLDIYKQNKQNLLNKKLLKSYVITTPDNEEIIVDNLSEFCRNNNLDVSCMRRVLTGNYKQHKGYTIRRYDYQHHPTLRGDITVVGGY